MVTQTVTISIKLESSRIIYMETKWLQWSAVMESYKCCEEVLYEQDLLGGDPQKVKLELTPGKTGAKWAKSQWKMHGRESLYKHSLATETGALWVKVRGERVWLRPD